MACAVPSPPQEVLAENQELKEMLTQQYQQQQQYQRYASAGLGCWGRGMSRMAQRAPVKTPGGKRRAPGSLPSR